jgi:hypothetical protein
MHATRFGRLLLVCVLVVGCSREGILAPPKNSADDMLASADAVGSANGIAMDNYSPSAVTFDYLQRQWQVLYEEKSRLVGDHFAVVISDDRPSESQLVRGL